MTNAAQQSLFDGFSGLPHFADLEDTINQMDLITRDPVFLADVPIQADVNVRNIKFHKKIGAEILPHDGRSGKVLLRQGPHPNYVKLGDVVLHRDEVRSTKEEKKLGPVMVDMVTTVIYNEGAVSQEHLDVFLCFMALMNKRHEDSGILKGEVTTTRTEICEMLGEHPSGRIYEAINEALVRLPGLVITKYYLPPDERTEAGVKVETLNTLILNACFNIHPSGMGPTIGRKGEQITVTLNPAFVQAMRGISDSREYVSKSLNMTKNLGYGTSWLRQLHRLLEARLDRGMFQMPLRELWLGCLGGSDKDLDPKAAHRWRRRRREIIKAFRDMEAIGFIDRVEFNITKRKLKETALNKPRTITLETSAGLLTVDLPPKETNEEWVRCVKGPQFYQGRPSGRKVFAHELLTATTDNESQIQKIIADLGVDSVVDIAHRRLKTLLSIIGHRMVEMRTTAWLSPGFPIPSLNQYVVYWTDKELHRLECAIKAQPFEQLPAAFTDMRDRHVKTKMDYFRKNLDLLAPADPKDLPHFTTVRLCFSLALERVVAYRGYARDILDETTRAIDPDKERLFADAARIAKEVAYQVGITLVWFEDMGRKLATSLQPFGSAEIQPAYVRAARRWPAAVKIIKEMLYPEIHPWERHLGMLFQQRLCEANNLMEIMEKDLGDLPNASSP